MRALYSLEWRDRDGGWLLFDVYTSVRLARAIARPWHAVAEPGSGFRTRIRKWVRP